MNVDKFGQQVYSEQDLIDRIMTGSNLKTASHWLVDSSVIDLQPIKWLVDELPLIIQYQESTDTVIEFDRKNQAQWLMPAEYQNLDVVKYVLDKCSNEPELQRAGEELLLYVERNLLDLLKFLVYLVDTMRDHEVVWGVGRGSSVASFVLYLIGVHRINSLYYDLDIKEFLR